MQLFPDIIVESKTNNSELVKAVKALQDNENHYIIMLDNSFDNLQVYQEQKLLWNLIVLSIGFMHRMTNFG